MPTLLEMATEIVRAHASTTPMSKEELIKEIGDIYTTLISLEKGEAVAAGVASEEEEVAAPAVSKRKAFGNKQVVCMICGKGMKTLSRHLRTAHDMTPQEYRRQFNIPRSQPLAAKDYSESRKQMAIERGLGVNLAKARAAKAKGKAKKRTTRKTEAAGAGSASTTGEE
ncbi:MAG: MucR family transcriptional regulator [Syntrophotaleaceae bacterium]